jgi:hypothetical protein
MPIFTGSSPSALMMNGAPMTWLAPSATPALSNVRRGMRVRTFDIVMLPRGGIWFYLYAGLRPHARLQISSASPLVRSRLRSAACVKLKHGTQ